VTDIQEHLRPTSEEPKEALKTTENSSEGSGRRVGRPPKEKRPVGRPKGEGTIMKEYRARMLNSPKSRKVLDSIFKAALDDDHKNQAAAWKIIVDRIVPVSGFEKEAGAIKGAAIQVNITGVAGVDVSATGQPAGSEDALEGEFSVAEGHQK
jgi:hypothetical protein